VGSGTSCVLAWVSKSLQLQNAVYRKYSKQPDRLEKDTYFVFGTNITPMPKLFPMQFEII
jgi:hypothetical protein